MKQFTNPPIKELGSERKRIAVGVFSSGASVTATIELLQQRGLTNFAVYAGKDADTRAFKGRPQANSVSSLSCLLPETAIEQLQSFGHDAVLLRVDLDSSEAEQSVATILLQSAAAAVQIHDRRC